MPIGCRFARDLHRTTLPLDGSAAEQGHIAQKHHLGERAGDLEPGAGGPAALARGNPLLHVPAGPSGDGLDARDGWLGWLERSPDNTAARLALAQAYNETGQTEAAEEQVEAAMSSGAQDPESHYNMGVMMIDGGDVEGGIAELETAVELRPDFPLAHKHLGYAYARTGEYQKAIDHFELFLEQDPDSPEAADVQQFIAALKDMIG